MNFIKVEMTAYRTFFDVFSVLQLAHSLLVRQLTVAMLYTAQLNSQIMVRVKMSDKQSYLPGS